MKAMQKPKWLSSRINELVSAGGIQGETGLSLNRCYTLVSYKDRYSCKKMRNLELSGISYPCILYIHVSFKIFHRQVLVLLYKWTCFKTEESLF